MTLNILLVTAGQVVAYIVGWILSTKEHGWRWMVGLGAAPAVLQFGLFLFLPETPRWLFKNGQHGAARSVLGRIYSGSDSMVGEVIRAMDQEISEEETIQRQIYKSSSENEPLSWLRPGRTTLAELLRKGGNRRALIIACLLQGLQQLCGFVGNTFIFPCYEAELTQFCRILSCTFPQPSFPVSDSLLQR